MWPYTKNLENHFGLMKECSSVATTLPLLLLFILDTVSAATLLYENDFEDNWGNVILSGFCRNRDGFRENLRVAIGEKIPPGHDQFSLSSAQSRTGNVSARVVLDPRYACWDSEAKSKFKIRSLIVAGRSWQTVPRLAPQTEYWIARSIFVPESTPLTNPPRTIMTQFKDDGANFLRNSKGTWQYRYRNSLTTTKNVNLGAIERGRWTDFVFRVKRSQDNTGFVEIWVNGVKKYSAVNENFITSNDPNDVGPHTSVGSYYGKYGENFPRHGNKNLPFEVFVDSIKIAEGPNGYSLVAPGGDTGSVSIRKLLDDNGTRNR